MFPRRSCRKDRYPIHVIVKFEDRSRQDPPRLRVNDKTAMTTYAKFSMTKTRVCPLPLHDTVKPYEPEDGYTKIYLDRTLSSFVFCVSAAFVRVREDRCPDPRRPEPSRPQSPERQGPP